tara:strand:+ start:964 stop:1785 length:822 start_codon:yes stop_codon:yes gene_type:complete
VNNNSYKFTLPKGDDKYINIPIEIKWDFLGQDDAVEEYQQNVVEQVIGFPGDFEVLRFAHAPYSNDTKTDIKYDFHFFSFNGGVPANPSTQVLTSTAIDWVTSYIPEGFTEIEIYYYIKPFTKSFFKLDFYDSKDAITQTNYFTVILPVQQGFTVTGITSSYKPIVDIKIPSFKLDYVGDKEGFFLYWLRNTKFLNISKFYMTAKFFDARLGVFVKMTNTPQSAIPSKFRFNPEDYFYYEVRLSYNEKTYEVWDNNNRVGTTSSIKWYEYINP